MADIVLQNLREPQNTGSGVADYVYLAPVAWFEDHGIKCPKAPFNDPGDEVVIKEAHVFKDGKAFVRVDLAPENNQLNAPSIGDLMFQKFDQSLEIFIPGSYAVVHEFAKRILNKPLVVLQKDSNCPANMWYQLGCDCVYAWIKMDFTTGTTKEGKKGYKGTVSYTNGYIQLYGAGIPPVLVDSDES